MKSNSNTVNSNKYIANSNTVNSNNSSNTVSGKKSFKEEFDSLLEKYSIKPNGIAILLAELLDDSKSIDYYKILVRENPPSELLKWAHYTKEMGEEGKIYRTKAIYFMSLIKKAGFRTKFKGQKGGGSL
jgi:hypothetical protein